MKKLVTVLAVLGFAAGANAADWSHNGSFRLIYQSEANTDFQDSGTAYKSWNQRLQLNTNIKVSDNVSAHVGLVNYSVWGFNGQTDQYPLTVDVPNLLHVNTAYGVWNISDEMLLRFGRGNMTVADGTVVAVNEWEPVQKAFDGAMLSYDHEFARMGFFAVRGGVDDTNLNRSGEYYGVTADFKSLPSWLKMAHVHYMAIKSNIISPADATEDTSRIGVTLKGDTNAVDYRATYAMHSGDGPAASDIDANMMDLEVGYSLDWKSTRLALAYHSDSGDTVYDGFHYDRHNNAGLMDVLGWGNLTYIRAGVTMTAQESVTVGADYYMFSKTEEDAATYDIDGVKGGNVIAAAGEKDLGTELDVWVKKSYNNNFSITGRYGQFAPGDAFANDETRQMFYLEGMLTF